MVAMNENGLTYARWLAAAGMAASTKAKAAWHEGEDPTDWRAGKGSN